MSQRDQVVAAMTNVVESGALPGVATLVWRGGSVVQQASLGWRDRENGLPIERDTIFRIASMTKPITSAVALMLLEEGRFALEDPIANWAPEFSGTRVLVSPTAPLGETVAAGRPITFEDLLTHRSGITYGAFWPGPLAIAYREALGGDIDSHVAPDDWIARLARLPLIDQPGATLHYGHSTDLLGLLIARMEGMPLGDVFERRLFARVGMADTGFTVTPEKHGRRAQAYGFDDTGRSIVSRTGPDASFVSERPEDMTFVSGGQGLWSTLDDYLTFARMLLGEGVVNGVRLLRPETLALMTTNRLTASQRASAEVARLPLFAAGHGYGMGVAVVVEPEKAAPTICGGHAGAVGWPGGFGGWWRADPADNSVLIFLTHNMVEPHQLAKGIGLGVWEAITQFQHLAAGIS